MVASETEPFLDQGLGGGQGIVVRVLECCGSFLVHLGVKEAGQNGHLWVSCIGWQWNGAGLFGVFLLVGMEGGLSGQHAPPRHGD